jgi:hypothetical protein
MEYKADRMEQEAYEKKLKNCKTKEEAERLHVNRMNGKLSELKSIVNNPNITKSEKLKEAQRIMCDTTKIAQVFNAFTKSAEFKDIPTEEEVSEAKQMEADSHYSEALENEKKVLEEMFEIEKNHLVELKNTVKIDVSL